MNAIDIEHLCKSYRGKGRKPVDALRDLNLSVGQGEVLGFLGPNGAGKSTTIRCLMGQISPTSGSSRIYGIPSADAAARRRLGYLPENPAFYDFLTAREYLRFVGKAFAITSKEVETAISRVLCVMDIDSAADRAIRGFSKGMVQRLGLAQAMLHDPDVYILDEPMSGLDPIGRAQVKELIKELKNKGKTVFFSTHITADIEVVCDRVGFIVQGELKALDTVKNILDQGVLGYTIQISSLDGVLREEEVPVDKLENFLRETLGTGERIERIEPKRKDVEGYFLDIVSRNSIESSNQA